MSFMPASAVPLSGPNSRSLVMPAGTPLDVMFDTMRRMTSGAAAAAAAAAADGSAVASPPDYDIPVASSSDVTGAVIAIMFPDNLAAPSDLSTTAVLAIARANGGLHPDSVRKIGAVLYSRWMRGDPYSTVTSMALLSPHAPMTASANNAVCLTVDHRKRAAYVAGTHPPGTTANAEFIHADMMNYMYHPTKQPSNTKDYALVVHSVTAKYSDASLDKFEAAVSQLRMIDADWWRRVAVATTGRMDARMTLHFCLSVANALSAGRQVSVFFAREKRLIQVAFVLNLVAIVINRKSLLVALNDMGPTPSRANAERGAKGQCATCAIRNSLVRCDVCGALLYCSEACRSVGWEKTHRAECKVYAKKIAGLPQPPGGSAVLKAKVKKQANDE